MKKIKIGDAEVSIKGPLSGDNPVLFAVHGAGEGAWIWKDVRAELTENADLLAVDLPGHGTSTGNGSESIETYREVAREAVRGMGIERPIAMGHSMGGAVVLDWALNYPDELSGIVLVSTGAKLKVNPLVFEAIKKDFKAYVALIGNIAFGQKVDRELIEICAQVLIRTRPEVVEGDFRACDAFDVMGKIGDISLPTLVLCGSEDKLTSSKYSEYLAENIKGSTLKVFSGAGHMLPVERPENVADYIRRFVLKVSQADKSEPVA